MTRRILKSYVISIEWLSRMPSLLSRNVLLVLVPKAQNQFHFPAITALIRDILIIPATGARVERLFNTTRDIYHYRRGRIKSKTIKELILFLYILRPKSISKDLIDVDDEVKDNDATIRFTTAPS
ncbi:hypothetical protein N7504_006302 [Penicillium tannophilum]|nr:hypothetical protein N7504_006302 [Penicillium tannophilum]